MDSQFDIPKNFFSSTTEHCPAEVGATNRFKNSLPVDAFVHLVFEGFATVSFPLASGQGFEFTTPPCRVAVDVIVRKPEAPLQ